MLYILLVVTIAAYYIGGEKWAHTLVRDFGCSLFICSGLWIVGGWNPLLLLVFVLLWGSFCIGDHGRWQWYLHALAVSASTLPFAYYTGSWKAFMVCVVLIPLFTYVTSRYLRFWDIIARGALFGSIPMIYKVFYVQFLQELL